MTAVILVGGPGIRLRPLTGDRPKSLVPVLDRPLMEHTIAYLESYGVRDIVLTLNYLPDSIKQVFGDGSRYGVHIVYCLEEEPRGTAGAVRNAEEYINDTFFVLNGDIFTDMDLADMLAAHRRNKATATISLTWVEDPSAFGVVETDDTLRVKRFIEKPPRDEATSHWINAGIYILEPAILEHVPAGQHYMFEKGLFPGILEHGLPVYGYPYRGYWLDMGTPAKYFTVNMDLLDGRVKSPAIDPGPGEIQYGPGTTIDLSASVRSPALIGSGCRIERDARVSGPVITGADCLVGEGASLENCILWDGVSIGAGARVNRCVIGSQMSVPAGQELVNTVLTVSGSAPLP